LNSLALLSVPQSSLHMLSSSWI